MSLRLLVASDVTPLAETLARLPLMTRYGRGADRLAADLAAALDRGDGLLVWDERRTPAGVAWFVRQGTFGIGGYLRFIAVAEGAQRAGVGAKLLEAFEEEVAPASRHVFLLVSDFNEPAQRFYARHGYAQVGGIPGLVLPDVTELIYWKRLR